MAELSDEAKRRVADLVREGTVSARRAIFDADFSKEVGYRVAELLREEDARNPGTVAGAQLTEEARSHIAGH